MPEYTSKAKLMCTGCPGAPSELKTKEAGKVKVKGNIIGVETDKDITRFPTCIAVPTAPKPCNPKLVKWSHIDEKVKFNNKAALKFPNMISCTSGPGVITMVYAGQYLSRNGATSDNPKDKDCGWKDCPKDHTEKITYDMEDMGCVSRTSNFPGGWPHPNGCGYKENKNKASKGPNAYKIQRHHILPCAAFDECDALKHNLKLMGFNINNGVPNGICLPENEEDIFWHNLQFHRGSHPNYNAEIEQELQGLDAKCRKWCNHSNKNINQELLITKIEKLAEKFRNKILNWQSPLIDGNSEKIRLQSFHYAGVTLNIPPANENRKYLDPQLDYKDFKQFK